MVRRPATTSGALATLAALSGLLGPLACGGAPEGVPGGGEAEVTGATESALIGGVEDSDDAANDGVLAVRIGDGSPFELCSAALVAPNLILTAMHCIRRNVTDDINCNERGEALNAPQVADDVEPRTIHVLTGSHPDFSSKPAANGKLILRPETDSLCGMDIALVVLDRPIQGIAPLRLRLDSGVQQGSTIRAVGYGQVDKNARLGTRYRKAGLRILGTGPIPRNGKTGRPAIAPSEFEVGLSICQGDSGGPALDEETGAVVGVVSRGVDCNLDFGHIYTRTVGFKTLFAEAFAAAGAEPLPEVDGPGATAHAASLKSGVLQPQLGDGDGTTSAESSSSDGGKGCAARVASTSTTSPAGAVTALALGVAVALVRRRRR